MAFTFWHDRGDGEVIAVPEIGLEVRVTLPGHVSGDLLAVFETVHRPGFGPPLHRHRENEVFRVLAGRYLYEVDGRRFTAETGDTISIPGGAAHAFVNIGKELASQHTIIQPALDATAFFRELAAAMKARACDPDALDKFGRKWGVEFLGPPLPAE